MSRALGYPAIVLFGLVTAGSAYTIHADDGAQPEKTPAALERWLQPQAWQRHTTEPILSLGEAGQFDDTHIFAPAVCRMNDKYLLCYCGSRGEVAQRVFQMGLATSVDGIVFSRHPSNPVFEFGDGEHSILTPTLLRNADGSPIRENNQLRLWFSSTEFKAGGTLHTLHEATSSDGIRWSVPSPPQLEDIYAPTIVKEGTQYQMWYTYVKADPWVFKHATSKDGKTWQVTPEPILTLTQEWEKGRPFYPTVLKVEGLYLMWYGSYWSARPQTTAIGFAVSADGIHWHKHSLNPVLRPDPARAWESNYVTSQSVIRQGDGRFRIWYASRKRPPFLNKYFAINTAHWPGPVPE